MDALVNYFVCKKSQLALATPTDLVGLMFYLSTGENSQVLRWSITSTPSLCTARGRSMHRTYARAP